MEENLSQITCVDVYLRYTTLYPSCFPFEGVVILLLGERGEGKAEAKAEALSINSLVFVYLQYNCTFHFLTFSFLVRQNQLLS